MVLFLCTVSYSKNNEQVVEKIKSLENSDQREIMFFIQNTIANINTNAVADGSMTSGEREREKEIQTQYGYIVWLISYNYVVIPNNIIYPSTPPYVHTYNRYRWHSSSPGGAGLSQLPESTLHTYMYRDPCFSLCYLSSITTLLHDSSTYLQGYLQW